MSPFIAKTVANAVAPLLKVLSNLEAVVEASDKALNKNHNAIGLLEAENAVAKDERLVANRIIEALGGIVNPKE